LTRKSGNTTDYVNTQSTSGSNHTGHDQIAVDTVGPGIVIESAPNVICIIDRDLRITYVNRVVPGLTVEETTGRCMLDFVDPEYRERVRNIIENVFETGRAVSYEGRAQGPYGQTAWYLSQVAPVSSDGMVNSIILVTSDITEMKQTEESLRHSTTELEREVTKRTRELEDINANLMEEIAKNRKVEAELRRSERKYRELAAMLPLAVFEMDRDLRLIYLNKSGMKLAGFSEEDLEKGIYTKDFVSPDFHELIDEIVRRLFEGETIGGVEYSANDSKGRELPILVHASGIFENGKAVGIRGTVLDMSDRIMLEESLQSSERKYRELVELLPMGIIDVNRKGEITFLNRWALENFGYSREDFNKGLHLRSLLAPEELPVALERAEKIYNGGSYSGNEYTVVRKDGERFPVLVSTAPIKEKGEYTGIRIVAADMSTLRAMENDIQRIQKLESLGLLAGGIAHDFNNLLTAVMGNISLARIRLAKQRSAKEALEEAEKATARAEELTRQLLTFSKGGAPVLKTTSIGDLVTETAKFMLTGSETTFEIDMDEDLWHSDVDRGQISQVIENLVVNSKEAMPGRGVIRIQMNNTEPEHGDYPDIAGITAGKYIKILIRDEGAGIPEKYIGRIFDPYFTTKQNGSGLGLAVTYSIIKKHGGYISVQSEAGRGTVFTILLPASRKQPLTVINGEEKSQPEKGTGRILIMDDNRGIRRIASHMLDNLGYTSETARDGEEAVEKYREAHEAGDPHDVVILDLTVPGGTGGVDAVKSIQRINPSARCIISSGYTNDPIVSEYGKYGFCSVITKPYNAGKMSCVLKEAMKESEKQDFSQPCP